jgi:hypothetical protein
MQDNTAVISNKFFMTLSFEMICKRKNNKIVRRHLSPWEKMLILQPKFPKK